MGRPERSLDGVDGPIAAFARDLRALRQKAGNPSYRELSRTALFAPSVLSSAAGGRRLPTLAVTLAFATACGGDHAAWERRWRTLSADLGEVGLPPRGALRAGANLARPAQLPCGSATFVGRTHPLTDATKLVDGSNPTTPILVNGPIGVGKTAFALRLADEVAAAYPDGQLYAELSLTNPRRSTDGIVDGFLRALGVSGSLLPEHPPQRLGMYRSLLAERRVFVLLDSALAEAQVRPLLGRTMTSQVVVTSRARLLGLDGVHRIGLGAFTREESTALLSRLIGEDRVAAERAAADALAEVCGDFPLAISIVGRMIAARPEWAIAHVASQLIENERPLNNLSVGDVSVHGRFEAAYRDLPCDGQRALGRLGGLRSRWTTAVGLAAAMACSVEVADGILETLVDAGLLARSGLPGRYYVPMMVSLFAASIEAEVDPGGGRNPGDEPIDGEPVEVGAALAA